MSLKKRNSFFILTIFIIFIFMCSFKVEAMNNKKLSLLDLAKDEFGSLTESEIVFFKAVAESKLADFDSILKLVFEKKSAKPIDPIRILKASRIVWLCTNRLASSLVGRRGIAIKGSFFCYERFKKNL